MSHQIKIRKLLDWVAFLLVGVPACFVIGIYDALKEGVEMAIWHWKERPWVTR